VSGALGTVGEYRAEGDDGPELDADLGGGDIPTADVFGPAGDDSPPLEGDLAALVELDDNDAFAAVAYGDDLERKAARGEKRIYARDANGAEVSQLHLKGDASIVLEQDGGSSLTVAADGSITIDAGAGTISIDAAGAVSISGTSVSMQTGSALGSHFLALHTALATWVPVPTDGGAALKTLLAPYIAQTPPGP
jgi:hypothetical protein